MKAPFDRRNPVHYVHICATSVITQSSLGDCDEDVVSLSSSCHQPVRVLLNLPFLKYTVDLMHHSLIQAPSMCFSFLH